MASRSELIDRFNALTYNLKTGAPDPRSGREKMAGYREAVEGFAAQAEAMSPSDIQVARAKNDAFGEYLRDQAREPVVGEAPSDREARLYGGLSEQREPIELGEG